MIVAQLVSESDEPPWMIATCAAVAKLSRCNNHRSCSCGDPSAFRVVCGFRSAHSIAAATTQPRVKLSVGSWNVNTRPVSYADSDIAHLTRAWRRHQTHPPGCPNIIICGRRPGRWIRSICLHTPAQRGLSASVRARPVLAPTWWWRRRPYLSPAGSRAVLQRTVC